MDFQYTYRLSFLGEWFQMDASIAREFTVFYYPSDSGVEIFDLKTKKTFLKRTRVDYLTEADFFVGARVDIFGRQISIVDYGDEATKKKLIALTERSFLMIKPDAVKHLGAIFDIVCKNGFRLANARMIQFQGREPVRFFGDIPDISVVTKSMMSGPVVGVEVVAKDALEKLKQLAGPDEPEVAVVESPNSIRALFGQNKIKNAVHVSQTKERAAVEICRFFQPDNYKSTELLEGTALGILKPHILKSGVAGEIIQDIERNGFKITALKICLLERPNCEEFYEIYRSVLPDYVQMVAQLSSGPCLAMEVQTIDKNKDSFVEFRKLCGPMDPSVAKPLRPNTLRAKYGQTKLLNAIHCTDLPEDAILELEYLFKIVE